ncbi:MAG: N-acyl homoserine lactonase family protein [Rhodobacteraceae bacterium]|nr:N-acyl homoserine lactonase family protein [Paracoccaceae bacterium]
MKVFRFDDDGRRVERQPSSLGLRGDRSGTSLGERQPARPMRASGSRAGRSSGIELYMFQTGTLRTKTKYIKMNQGEDPFEIPIPWFLIKHPQGNVVIDGGNAIETAIDPRGHWGDVVDAYEPVMDVSENCVDQCKSVGVDPSSVRYVLQSHLHLDHTGALGHFHNATVICQRVEYEYAFNPQWFCAPAYIRADFDRPGLKWQLLSGPYSDGFDLFGDGTIRTIFTPGHSPGHQSFLLNLPGSGPILLAVDAAYTLDHWENKALPGLLVSASDAADSVAKLRNIAADTNALVVTGHDPDNWSSFRKAPHDFYD